MEHEAFEKIFDKSIELGMPIDYRTDLMYDKEVLKGYTGPFVWVVYAQGTYVLTTDSRLFKHTPAMHRLFTELFSDHTQWHCFYCAGAALPLVEINLRSKWNEVVNQITGVKNV